MHLGRYSLAGAACALLLLCGCGSSSYGVSSGSADNSGSGTGGGPTGPPTGGNGPTGTNDTVVATPSIAGTVTVIAGSTRNVAIVFTSSDGRPISGFGISGSLGSLPAGWKGPSGFACAQVSTGSGCVLNLTYAPTAAASGSLTLNYVFVDNATVPKTGVSLVIPYLATPQNNVVAEASPSGQVNALVGGGSQTVTVTFTTDDGTPATNLVLTTLLSSLPAGWSAASPTFACASVSVGNGCGLDLTFAPTVASSGTIVLSYSYADNAGVSKTGTLNIAYAGTTNDNVVATASPSGQVNAVAGGSRSVAVTFTTDDGRLATVLHLTTDLTSLPTGWSSTMTTFSCGAVSTGTGCQLPLTYAPTGAGNGTLTLSYSYFDHSGNTKTGSLSIAYRATTSDNVTGTPSPSALGVLSGAASTPVQVTFTTDDGNAATALSVTTDLGALPSGWSSGSNNFTCASVSSGSGCQLSLAYAPLAAASGTLTLAYGYLDDSGAAKTGTVSIPYAATLAPHLYLADVAAGLFFCSLNSDGTLGTCAMTGTGFTAPAGIVFSGSHAYVTDYNASAVYLCTVASDGSLGACTSTGSNFQNPVQLAISGTTLYASDAFSTAGVTTCAIASDGTLSGCSESSGTGTLGIAANSSYAYVGVGPHNVDVCAIGAGGALAGCTDSGSGFSGDAGITLSSGYAYVANENAGTVSVCTINSDGTLTTCPQSSVGSIPSAVAVNGSQAYVSDLNSNVYVCAVDSADGSLGSCVASNGGASFNLVLQIAVH